MFSAAKKPFLMPMWIGQCVGPVEPTSPIDTVSAARAGGRQQQAESDQQRLRRARDNLVIVPSPLLSSSPASFYPMRRRPSCAR